MSNSYAIVSALIFALVAVGHLMRIVNGWTVRVGTYDVPMNASWAGLVGTVGGTAQGACTAGPNPGRRGEGRANPAAEDEHYRPLPTRLCRPRPTRLLRGVLCPSRRAQPSGAVPRATTVEDDPFGPGQL